MIKCVFGVSYCECLIVDGVLVVDVVLLVEYCLIWCSA
jgi:hypothetical protein